MKYTALYVVLSVFFCSSAYAQIAKIVSVEGSVSIKADATSQWQSAKPQMYLEKEAEIKTGAHATCILAFDENLSNTATIDENTTVKLEDLKPVHMRLPRGRVFILIDDELSALMPFEVQTSTAVAGVRGTGESVECQGQETIVQCFEGAVYLEGIDSEGFRKRSQTLSEGSGAKIVSHGRIRTPFKISMEDYQTWYDHKIKIKDLQKTQPSPKSRPSITIDAGEGGGWPPIPTYKTIPSYGVDSIRKLKENKNE